jgi:hypothetical protein
MIRRVFSKEARQPHAPSQAASPALSSELSSIDLEHYYLRVIEDCLRRMLVPVDSIELRVRRTRGPNKLPSFSGYVRILKWDPIVTPVLLQNLPVIDARIRKMANASVILEYTHFGGLWFQATSSTEGSPKALVGLPLEMIHMPGARRAA